MNSLKTRLLAGVLLVGSVSGVLAQNEDLPPEPEPLPPYAYDAIADISLVTTAVEACEGIKPRDKPLMLAIQDVYSKLALDGVPAADVAKHFESEFARGQVGLRGDAFRLEYGLGPENDAAFCQAVRAKAKDNKPFRKMMRISR